MITNIQTTGYSNKNNRIAFKSKAGEWGIKLSKLFIKSQESLSSTRVIQDTATNWLPKAVFTRSPADLADMTFLEAWEDFIFYFMAPVLGEGAFRKIYPKLAPKGIRNELNELIPKSAEEILKNKALRESELGKRIIPMKAGMILGCTAIPAAEYGLSFAKNLFTLKIFNKSDFNNIANLDKDQVENEHQQRRVKENARKNLIGVGIVSAVGLGLGTLFATTGHKSPLIQKVSEKILTPYEPVIKFIEKFKPLTDKKKAAVKNLVNLDFGIASDAKKGGFKLKLGKGQLALTAIAGFFGYKEAAEDRGKLDVYEVCTRVPIVVLYTIFGSSLFDNTFKSILFNKGKYQDLIKKDANGELDDVPALKELDKVAQKVAALRKTKPQDEFNRLVKEKAVITAIPYAFSLLFVGFLLAAISRFWTQYRYDKGIGRSEIDKKTQACDNFSKTIKK